MDIAEVLEPEGRYSVDAIIRTARESDADDMATINFKARHLYYRGMVADDILNALGFDIILDKFVTRLQRDSGRDHTLVYEMGWKVLGYIISVPSNAYYVDEYPVLKDYPWELKAFYVDLNSMWFGVWKALLKRFKEHCASNWIPGFFLFCLENNEPSRKFYEKQWGKLLFEWEKTIVHDTTKWRVVAYGFKV